MKVLIDKKYNRRIFPVYKGLAWDPLFYYATIFLFLTQVKGIEPAQVMYAQSLYSLFLLLFQIPSAIIVEKIGSRKSLVLGGILVTIQIGMMSIANNFWILVIAYFICALGYALQDIGRNTILYDSTQKCVGRNSFASINAKGSSVSYALGAITSVMTGYLYIVNPYIPIILSTIISALSVILAYRFEDIKDEKEEHREEKTTIAKSIKDMKLGFRFVLKSNRLRALILFIAIFSGLLSIIGTYENSLLSELNVPPQYFGIIFAILTLVQCISVRFQDKIHNLRKNKTLTYISIPVVLSLLFIGIINTVTTNFVFIIIVVLICFFVHYVCRGPYWVLEDRYIVNFTSSKNRAKVLSVTYLIRNIGEISIGFLSGLLLDFYSTGTSYLIIGIFSTISILLVLNYMKTRVGLKPEEYEDKDIKM